MRPRRRDPLVAAVLLVVLAPAAGLSQGLYFEGGGSLARGDYVYTQSTNSGGAAAGLAWSGRRLTLRATLPYFVRDTRLLTETGEVPTEGVEPVPTSSHEGSVSDPLLQVQAVVLRSDRSAIGLSASVKVPVVEAGAFGTGEWDVGGGISLSRFVGSSTMLGLDAAYWHMGDLPDLPLQDSVAGTFSVGRGLGRSWLVSASVSGARSTLAGYEDPWWASLLLSRTFSGGIVGVTATLGLTDTAADVSVGLVWRLRLDGSPAAAKAPSGPRAP